jgi:hypothetical protein
MPRAPGLHDSHAVAIAGCSMMSQSIRPHPLRPLSAGAFAAILGLAQATAAAPASPNPAPAHKAAKSAPAASPIVEKVDPKAVDALRRMSAYLQGLPAFALTSQTSLELVLRDGQKVLVDGVARYKVRRPGGFVIDVESNLKTRRFVYDGKQFTVFSPKLGYFATVAAPATNRETLDFLWNKFRVALPLEDLFRWSDPGGARDDRLQSGFRVGTVTLDGVETDQYVFREPGFDWQIWIQQGDQPIPRRVVIVDRTDPAQPAYTARLTWDTHPTFAPDEFAFHPGKGATAVRLEAVGK